MSKWPSSRVTEDKRRDEREMKFTLTMPSRVEGRANHIAIDDHVQPKGRYPESFVLLSLLEVYQEWGVKKVDTWSIIWVPDGRHG